MTLVLVIQQAAWHGIVVSYVLNMKDFGVLKDVCVTFNLPAGEEVDSAWLHGFHCYQKGLWQNPEKVSR